VQYNGDANASMAAFHLTLTMLLESFHYCHLSNVKQGEIDGHER